MTERVRKMIYVFNARLPTEKAHGYQACKMCEAYAAKDLDVVLMHPYRRQFDPALQGRTVFDYYGVRSIFQVKTLPNWDVVPLERFFPRSMFMPVFFLHALIWGLYAALTARKEKADLYYTRDSQVAYWLSRLGLPLVYEEHGVPKRGQRWLLSRITRSPGQRLMVTVTSFVKEIFLEMGFPETEVIVRPNGVDLSLFKALPNRETCRQQLGLEPNRLLIGYVGRFLTMGMEKGIPELLRAMSLLPAINGSKPLLVCVGGPMDAVSAYLKVADSVGVPAQNLKFIDSVSHTKVPYWIKAFDVAVAPFPNIEHYAYHMCPIKVFEYMAAGVPIVASDLPSIREVLAHGENAWLVEPGNEKALAEGINRLIEDASLSSKLAANARQAVDRFTWEGRARAILNHARKDLVHRG